MLLVAEPILGDEEKAALRDVIESGWITMGSRVQAFEQAFARKHMASESVAVNSCTAALHLILLALGIGPGDEVLVPSLTFVATANSVLYTGAKPVFVDIESLEKPLMSVQDAASKCTRRTKAVIVMHYAGYLTERDAWRRFADSNKLLLIEDAAHAVGLPEAGTIGDAAAFSFYGNKNMTTAEGGAVISRHQDVLDKVRLMRAHGMTATVAQRLASRSPTYDVTALGYNYRMDELHAAMGLVQLERLTDWNLRRGQLTALYRPQLAQHCPEIILPFDAGQTSSYHIMPVLLPRAEMRQSVIEALRAADIQTTIHYPPVHRLSIFRELTFGVSLPKTEEFADRELTLPLHPRMQDWQIEMVTTALRNALHH